MQALFWLFKALWKAWCNSISWNRRNHILPLIYVYWWVKSTQTHPTMQSLPKHVMVKNKIDYKSWTPLLTMPVPSFKHHYRKHVKMWDYIIYWTSVASNRCGGKAESARRLPLRLFTFPGPWSHCHQGDHPSFLWLWESWKICTFLRNVRAEDGQSSRERR